MLKHIERRSWIASLQEADLPEKTEAEKEAHQGKKQKGRQQVRQLYVQESSDCSCSVQGRRFTLILRNRR